MVASEPGLEKSGRLEKHPSLQIVIVNWNTGHLLLECLESIGPALDESFELHKVIVVDNGSKDGAFVEEIKTEIPIELIMNPGNEGFAKACNQGVADSSADYLLFLNPDVRLFSDSLHLPLKFMEEAADNVGICGIRLLKEDGSFAASCARFPTFRVLLGKVTGLSRLVPRLFPSQILSVEECSTTGPVDQVIGAFFLVRSDLFSRLNGFDERYFLYYEEVDFSWRALELGHTSYYLSDVTAYHREGGSSSQAKGDRLFYSLRSRFLYAQKNLGRTETWVLVVLSLTVEFAARLGPSILQRGMSAKEVTGAYWRFLLSLPSLAR